MTAQTAVSRPVWTVTTSVRKEEKRRQAQVNNVLLPNQYKWFRGLTANNSVDEVVGNRHSRFVFPLRASEEHVSAKYIATTDSLSLDVPNAKRATR